MLSIKAENFSFPKKKKKRKKGQDYFHTKIKKTKKKK